MRPASSSRSSECHPVPVRVTRVGAAGRHLPECHDPCHMIPHAEGACPPGHAPSCCDTGSDYLRCLLTSAVISNIETLLLPPKTFFSLSSALIIRRSRASCSPLRLMYAQTFLVISVRGMGESPTTAASSALGVIGFMNAGFGARLRALFFAADLRVVLRALFLAVDFLAALRAVFLAALRAVFLAAPRRAVFFAAPRRAVVFFAALRRVVFFAAPRFAVFLAVFFAAFLAVFRAGRFAVFFAAFFAAFLVAMYISWLGE